MTLARTISGEPRWITCSAVKVPPVSGPPLSADWPYKSAKPESPGDTICSTTLPRAEALSTADVLSSPSRSLCGMEERRSDFSPIAPNRSSCLPDHPSATPSLASGAPQSWQNRRPLAHSSPQWEQFTVAGILSPQNSQNFAEERFACPHSVQVLCPLILSVFSMSLLLQSTSYRSLPVDATDQVARRTCSCFGYPLGW